jgi:hypothetical protein
MPEVSKKVLSPPIPATGIVRCVLEGTPTPGDQLFWYWLDARGGRSASSCVVGLGHSLEDLAGAMAGRSEFGSFFALAAKKNVVTCIVHPGCPHGTFCTETLGSGSVKLSLEE